MNRETRMAMRTALVFFVFVALTACAFRARPAARNDLDAIIAEVAARTLGAEGGATVDLLGGHFFTNGERLVAVSISGGSEATLPTTRPRLESALVRFVNTHPELLAATEPRLYLGTWRDDATRRLYIDRTLLLPYTDSVSQTATRTQAWALARKNGQLAIYDLGTGETLPLPAISSR